MAKAKKVLSTVLVALFTVFTVLSYVPAKAAAGPTVKMVAQPQAEYKVGDKVTIKFNAGTYKGNVQYRVFLWQVGKGNVGELYSAYAKAGYFGKAVKGTQTVTVSNFTVKEAGQYYFAVFVKANNANKATAKYVYSAKFVVKAEEEKPAEVTIKELVNPADITVNEGEKVTLPETVKAKMSDGTEKEVAVKWDVVDTTKAGEYTVNGTVEGTTLKPAVKVVVKAVALKVESVSAIKANALKVVFNKAVDTTKAVLTTKRGNTVVPFVVTWNDAKTEATLTSSVKLVAGDYTVAVTGVETEEGKNVATTTVAPERIEKIELSNNGYRDKDTNTTVTVEYKLFNQYSEEITENYNVNNFTVTSSKGSVASNQPSSKGVITITGVAADVNNVIVTVIDKTFAKSVSNTVNIQAPKALDSIVLGQPQIPEGKDKITYDATDVVVPYTATNQFGEEMKLDDVSALTIVSSNSTVLSKDDVTVKTIGTEKKLVISKFGEFEGAKDITLTVIVNATGKSSKVTFTVYGKAVANNPVLVAPTTNPGVGDNPFNVELKMYDVYGNEMKAEDVAALTADDVTIISSNKAVFDIVGTTPALVNKKAVIKINAKAEGTANLSITVNSTGKTSTIAITVVEAKYPASVTLSPDYNYAVKDGKITLKATFKDQYGNEIKQSDNIVKISADNDYFTVSGSGLKTTAIKKSVTDMVNDGIALVASDWAKVTNVKVELVKDTDYVEDKVLDTKTVVVQSVKSDASLTYEVKEIGTIADAANGSTSSPYAVAVEAYAKDASGNKVSLKGDEILNIVSASDKLVVSGVKIAAKDVDADMTTKVFVTIATNTGVKVFEAPVKISSAAPVAQSIKAMFGDDEVTEVELAAGDYTLSSLLSKDEHADNLYFLVKDQYNTTALTNDEYISIFVKSDSGVSKVTDKLTVTKDKEYTVTAITANGLTVSVKVIGK